MIIYQVRRHQKSEIKLDNIKGRLKAFLSYKTKGMVLLETMTETLRSCLLYKLYDLGKEKTTINFNYSKKAF